VRDAAGDDPIPGTVHVAKLVPSVRRRLDSVELGRGLTYLRKFILSGGRRYRVAAVRGNANDGDENRKPESRAHFTVHFLWARRPRAAPKTGF
jgi:hypothetical protein